MKTDTPISELIAATAGLTEAQRARLLDRTIAVMSHNHRHAQTMGVRVTIELLLTQMVLEAQNLSREAELNGNDIQIK